MKTEAIVYGRPQAVRAEQDLHGHETHFVGVDFFSELLAYFQ